MEKLCRIYYGNGENDYIRRYLKENEIINGYLTEAKAFELFYTDMVMANNYLRNNYDNVNELISAYDEDEDYCVDEYQIFIIELAYDEDITKMATGKMGNTLYYDNENEIYLTGITDLGTSRGIVPTDIKVVEESEEM